MTKNQQSKPGPSPLSNCFDQYPEFKASMEGAELSRAIKIKQDAKLEIDRTKAECRELFQVASANMRNAIAAHQSLRAVVAQVIERGDMPPDSLQALKDAL